MVVLSPANLFCLRSLQRLRREQFLRHALHARARVILCGRHGVPWCVPDYMSVLLNTLHIPGVELCHNGPQTGRVINNTRDQTLTVISSLMVRKPNARRRCSLSHDPPAAFDPIRVHELRREPPSHGLAWPSILPCTAVPGQCMIGKRFEKNPEHGIGGCVCKFGVADIRDGCPPIRAIHDLWRCPCGCV